MNQTNRALCEQMEQIFCVYALVAFVIFSWFPVVYVILWSSQGNIFVSAIYAKRKLFLFEENIYARSLSDRMESCERYGTGQLCLEVPANRYVQFISKLNRKHCRVFVGLLTGHINLQYMLQKMRRAKTPSCNRCGAEKEILVHILCECLC